jgi:gamma-glutamylcyclotransferase (GGCT)/AIG2-like uncharacterized protein YtfP
MNYIAVYGTLREGLINYGRFGEQKVLGTYRINGYDLYCLFCPEIRKGKGSIVIELQEVNDITLAGIRRIERGCYDEHRINLDGKEASIWIARLDLEKPSRKYKINNGDYKSWIETNY